MKAALVKYGPLAIGMDWWHDITFSYDMIMHTSQKGDAGGHCMVLYGYNKIGWLVQNSWGKGWGNKGGRLVIPYHINIREVVQIVDNYSEAEQKARIAELEKSNAEMRERTAQLGEEVLKLRSALENLEKYKELTDEQKKQMAELIKQLSDSENQINTLLARIEEQQDRKSVV